MGERQTGRARARQIMAELDRREALAVTPPSVTELAALMGISPGVVAYHLRRLVALGWVAREPRRGRTWRVTETGRAWLTGAIDTGL